MTTGTKKGMALPDVERNLESAQFQEDIPEIHIQNGGSGENVDPNFTVLLTRKPFTEFVEMGPSLFSKGQSSESKNESEDSEALDEELETYIKSNDTKKLKVLLRTNQWCADDHIRSSLWQRVCKYLHKADGNLFDEMENELFNQSGRPQEALLPSFVDFDHLPSYHLSQQGIEKVHRILAVINHTNPDVIYSPTLFATISIFLHYMSPSDVYNCAYGLLRAKENFIMQTKVSVEASKLVLRDLAKKFAKAAYVHLVRSCNSVDVVFDGWMFWIFAELPFPYLVRVMDSFLLEGVKVLYRAALSILILYTKHTAKKGVSGNTGESSAGLINKLKDFCREMPFQTDKFLRTGFKIRGLTRKEIKKLQVKHEMYLNSRTLMNHEMQKSASVYSFSGVHSSRSFSGPMTLQNIETAIVTQDMLYAIWSWIPPRYAVRQPELLYTSEEHGTSLMTLYTRVENYEPTLIVIKTTTEEVFGAFCSTYWRDRKQRTKNLSYFGTGESFIFTLVPNKHKYEWVGLHQDDVPKTANMFLAGDNSMLTVGGGNGEAIQLDANLLHCRTEKCDTFDNEPLCSNEDFQCKVVEVYGFQ